jgi:predicted MFS family arabinose efflux permease
MPAYEYAPIARADQRAILGVQAVRALVYGIGSVLIGSSLAAEGMSAARVGVVLTSMLAGMALASILVGRQGDRLGRRRVYGGLLLVMGAAGAAFALSRSMLVLVAAGLTGTMSTDPNESGPITSLEQAMLGGSAAGARSRVFGRYNAVAYLAGAFGSLMAGGPAAFRRLYPHLPADQRWLLSFPIAAVACFTLVRRLSDAVEAPRAAAAPPPRSRPIVRRLALLFAGDAFAGGLVVQAFIAFWLRRRFGAPIELVGVVLFAAGLLQAASSVVAGRIGERVGLLNTMVFTHLPSNVLLAAVPLAPTLPVAIALLLARFMLSQMDVPARQAYVVSVVGRQERTSAAAYTNTARYLTRPAGPLVAGGLMQHVAMGAPFVAAGALKALYDVVLYFAFRRVPAERRD